MAQPTTPGEDRPMYTLYTCHDSPFAQRVHIVLAELQLQFKEVIIDLDKPREDWFLKISPDGLVPCLTLPPHPAPAPPPPAILESAIIAQFLAEAHPRRLFLPSPTAPQEAWVRSRIFYFIDRYFNKCRGIAAEAIGLTGDAQVEKLNAFVAAVKRETEPLLVEGGSGPFFCGEQLGYAEAILGPFVLRLRLFIKSGIFPKEFDGQLEKEVPRFKLWMDAIDQHPSARVVWNEESTLAKVRKHLASLKAAQKE